MHINPGGRLDIQEIVGRDQEIARYWDILERQGLILSAERRIGKTHIALKMQAECQPRYIPFYQDLEGVHSIKDLIRSIYRTVDGSLSVSGRWKSRLAKWSTLLPERIGGLELPGIQENWSSLLTVAFDDLIGIAGDRAILMMWDEFPLMLYNLKRREGEGLVIELLDHLRALRQAHARHLRFLLTGSVGLHLVIRALQRAGNANDPVNDMFSVTVPPMGDDDTRELAAALLDEIDVDRGEIANLARTLAAEVGGFPYYIHHVADQLHQLRRRVAPADVLSAVDVLIYDSRDPAHFRYYLSRIDAYYDHTEKDLALATLDCIARNALPQSAAAIANLVRHQNSSATDEEIREILNLLVEDHYLVKQDLDNRMCYGFRWKLVRRWWEKTRT